MASDPVRIDAIDEPAVLVDGQGAVVRVNAAARLLFGHDNEIRRIVRSRRTFASVARARSPDHRPEPDLVVDGELYRVTVGPDGAGHAVVRFTRVGAPDAQAPDLWEDGPDPDTDEPTAEIVRLDHRQPRPRAATPTPDVRTFSYRTLPPAPAAPERPSAVPPGPPEPPARARSTPRPAGRLVAETSPPLPPHDPADGVDEEQDEETVQVGASRMRARLAAQRLSGEDRASARPTLLVRADEVADANAAALGRLPRVVGSRWRKLLAPDRDGITVDAYWALVCSTVRRDGHAEVEAGLRFSDLADPVTLRVRAADAERADAWVVSWEPRASAEHEGRVRERLALALARSIRPLLVRDDVDGAIEEALGTIGSAIRADRCFLVLIDADGSDGRARNRARYAWAAEGIDALPAPAKGSGSERGVVPPRWIAVLSSGGVLVGDAEAFPVSERVILERYGVRSLVVVPVRADGRLLGFLGLDACRDPRAWTTSETEILRGMADSFAGAFRRRDAARALRAGQDRYEAALRGADFAVWEVDARTGQVAFSDAVDRQLGLHVDQTPTSVAAFQALVLPADRPRLRDVVRDHLARRGERVDVEVRVAPPGRVPRWVQLRGRITAWGPDGEALRAHGTLQDIDGRKRLTDELESARAAAVRASELKSRFLANMSHEIRTPLNAVLGCAALLHGTGLSHQQADLVETLQSSGEHLLGLLEQILDVSRIESGQLELVSEPFDLRALVQEIRDLFRPMAADRGLALDLSLDERLPPRVRGDALRFRQVLVNLVDNAVKFTEQGGITLMAWCPDPADIDHVRVEVADTGIGIAPERLDDLFDTFSQGEDGDTRRYGGPGLGLSISRRLCELMGGRLDVESEPGRGSLFRLDVRLVAVASAGDPVGVQLVESTKLPEDLGILVVEDNAINQKVAVGMLNRLGCRAEVTDDGLAAVRAVREQCPDVVLMDLQMPGMDGLEATRRIRAHTGSDVHPWIIAVTAAAQSEDRQRSLACGMNDYLAKPVRLDALQRALERAVEHLSST